MCSWINPMKSPPSFCNKRSGNVSKRALRVGVARVISHLGQEPGLLAHSQTHLNKIAHQLNERPRKSLQFETPAERFNECVALTG